MRELAFWLAGLLTLSGCGSMGTMSAQRLAEEPLPSLCDTYSRNQDPKVWSAIESRAGFSADEIAAISDRRVFVGMSENALICAWGIPSHHGGVIKRISEGGVYKQYYYRHVDWTKYQYTPPREVILQDGRVTGVYQ